MSENTHTYKFNVSMSCGGCSGAVNRVLGKLEGSSFLLPFPVTLRWPLPWRPFFRPLKVQPAFLYVNDN
jgi:hypothetical protein